MKKVLFSLALLLLPVALFAQGLPVKSGATSDLATVDTKKNLRISTGVSTRVTHIASAGALGAAAAHTLSIEASAGTGFKLVQWCFGVSNATAAVSIAVKINRTTTASSAGTALTVEGTGTTAISKMDPAASNFGGVARLDGTPGTSGATLDQYNYEVGIIATGAGGTQWVCQRYDYEGAQLPTVAAGTTNGLIISIPSFGTGSLAGSLSATIIEE